MKKPCADCPFRPRTFTPLTLDDAAAMVDAVASSTFFMYCHRDQKRQAVECNGSVRLRTGDQSGVVFKSEDALLRAHARSLRQPVYHWSDPDGEDALIEELSQE